MLRPQIFAGNQADNGGAVAVFASKTLNPPLVTFLCCLFVDNSATVNGGGFLYFGDTAAASPFPLGRAAFNNVIFDGNAAAGGFFSPATRNFNAGGGAIALFDAWVAANELVFRRNTASFGALVFEFAASKFDCLKCKFMDANIDINYKDKDNAGVVLTACTGNAGTIVLLDQLPDRVLPVPNQQHPVANLNLQLYPKCGGSSITGLLGNNLFFTPSLIISTGVDAANNFVALTCASVTTGIATDSTSFCCSENFNDCLLFPF